MSKKKLFKTGISIVIPCHNEEGNISNLSSSIEAAFKGVNFPWEVIWVDDSSSDNTYRSMQQLKRSKNSILKNSYKIGQSSSIAQGLELSQYEILATIDGDGQNNPRDLLQMYRILDEDKSVDFCQGKRIDRQDGIISRIFLSKVGNFAARRMIGITASDLGCGTKAFRRNVLEAVPFRGEIHRLYAAHAFVRGFNVMEVEVTHSPRIFGESKYGISRMFKFFLDIFFVKYQFRIQANPVYLFGAISALFLTLGTFSISMALMLRILSIKTYIDGSLILGGLILYAIAILSLFQGLTTDLIIRRNKYEK